MKLALTNLQQSLVAVLALAIISPNQVLATGNNSTAVESNGNQMLLAAPARRIVSLSPHITELLFAAGAGDRVVGVVDYSDYPALAKNIRRVGSAFKVDMEALVSLKPDLVVAWTSGNSLSDIAMIKQLGIPVFYSDPKKLTDIPEHIRKLAQLTATDDIAEKAATQFTRRYLALKARFSGATKVPVFYQLWHQPIMTVNKNHLINDVIELCGGVNVFASLPSLTPVVGVEDVIDARPEYIISSSVSRRELTARWARWMGATAIRENKMITVPADLLHRQGPRILQAAEIMCDGLVAARS